MELKKKLKKISNDKARISIGVFVCLFSIYLSLNLVSTPKYDYFIYLARAITWVISFLFGGVFSYVFYILMFIGSIIYILKVKKKKIKYGLFLTGAILFSVGGIILIAQGIVNSSELVSDYSLSSFGTNLVNLVVKTKEGFKIDILSNTGIIGLFIVSLCNNEVLSNIIGSILLVGGLTLLLIKPIRYIVKKIQEYRNFNAMNSNHKDVYTKDRDLTVTTLNLDTLDNDDDDINIETKKEEVKLDKAATQEIYYDRVYETKKEEKVISKPYNDQIYTGSDFVDKPLKKARFNDGFNNLKVNSEVKHREENESNDDSLFEKANVKQPVYESTNSYSNNVSPSVSAKPTFDYEKDLEKENKVSGASQVRKKKIHYVAPSLSLLESRTSHDSEQKNEEIAEERSDVINQALSDLGVRAKVVSYKIGPSVTRYDIQTERNESIKKMDSYINDICIRLGGVNARFSPIVLGKTTSGLEISNAVCSIVNFKDCLQALNRLSKTKGTSLPIGKDINNELLTFDLQDAPHLLVSGTTGSGKSILVHSLIMTLIMRNSPEDLKLVLIDPKKVEFNKYREIPHLLCPLINLDDKDKILDVLNAICDIMEERYELFAKIDCSKIKEYNEWAKANGKETLPIIVVVIDEYADLVDNNKRVSEPVVRIGQKARAAGIHMIIATQRPSVNVINGVIKANIPSRIALLSSSYTDSATILDQGGAEKLIGNGDMLVKCAILSNTSLVRCQGAFVSNQEISAVCDYLRANYETDYDPKLMDVINKPVFEEPAILQMSAKEARFNSEEEVYKEIKSWTMGEEYISTSKIQNTFGMGFNRASRIFKRLQAEGIIDESTAQNSSKGCKVLVHDFAKEREPYESQGSKEQSTFKKF